MHTHWCWWYLSVTGRRFFFWKTRKRIKEYHLSHLNNLLTFIYVSLSASPPRNRNKKSRERIRGSRDVRSTYKRDVKIFLASRLALQNILRQFHQTQPPNMTCINASRSSVCILPFPGIHSFAQTSYPWLFSCPLFLSLTHILVDKSSRLSHTQKSVSHRTQTQPSSHNSFIKCRLRL